MLIQLNDVSVAFGNHIALHPTTLRFELGSTTALIGPSGCGKSTLLKLILGLRATQSGTIQIGESTLAPSNVLALRQSVGYVIQEGGLFPHLSIRDNAALLSEHLRRPGSTTQRRIDALSDMVRLDHALLDRYPHELSGGQRQRAALLRALVLDPPILLLDEPLGALDPITRVELQDELKRLIADLGKTVIIVSHDVFESAYLAPRLLVMRAGHVIQEGSLQTLQNDPVEDFVHDFITAQKVRAQEVSH